ncbi:MAG: hypothetical protein FJ100_22510, partial [Deltaproteobacteria bacterium]|nr:hypothetical protein [Deltaproteobacteria bacterium]
RDKKAKPVKTPIESAKANTASILASFNKATETERAAILANVKTLLAMLEA